MKKLLKRILLLGYTREELSAVTRDIQEENRRSLLVYSAIVAGGMGILLFLSLFVDVLVTSRLSYTYAILVGLVLHLFALRTAKRIPGLVAVGQYILIFFLLGFGIVLGTHVEPQQASTSFAVLIFVAPLLFTDLPFRINTVTVLSIVVYIFAARATQSDEMFGFNMSVIMPYGLTNLVLTHFTSKQKIERIIYAREKRELSEKDQLTGLRNRRCLAQDAKDLIRGAPQEIGVCSFDVNNLKLVNDNLGHAAGDELLIAAAGAIGRIFGKYGKVYRTGGDEFTAVLTGIFPSGDELLRMLDRESERCCAELGFVLSVSGGIACGESDRLEALITEADRAMYVHKSEYHAAPAASAAANPSQMNKEALP